MKLRILIVEDSQLMRDMMRRVLVSVGIRQIEAIEDPVTALERFAKNCFDLVFVDWEMPEMTGIDFVRAIRDQGTSRNPYVPIIMVTSHADASRVVEARDAGVHEYLVKPVTGRAMLSRLESVINKPRPFIRTATYFGPAPRKPISDSPGMAPNAPMPDLERALGNESS